MTSTNKQKLFILLLASALMLVGCSTKNTTTSKVSKKETTLNIPEAAAVEKIDLSSLPSVTNSSSKEEVFSYAVALMTHSRYSDAAPLFLSLTQEHPELSGPHINLAICLFQTKQLKEAETRFKQTLALKPEQPIALDYLGRIYRAEGKFEAARDSYLNAIEVAPDYASAQRNLAILYDLYLGQPKEALKHYLIYQRLIKTPDKFVAIWIRDLAKRTGTSLETNTDKSKEAL